MTNQIRGSFCDLKNKITWYIDDGFLPNEVWIIDNSKPIIVNNNNMNKEE